MKNVSYRRAVPTDKSAVEWLFEELLRTVGDDETDGFEDGYLDKFFGGLDLIYVAESDGETVGFVSVELYPDHVYIDDIAVTERFRGMGIGTKLIGLAERYAVERKVPSAVLHVERTNILARYFYQRLGYTVTDDEEIRFRMAKRIRKE